MTPGPLYILFQIRHKTSIIDRSVMVSPRKDDSTPLPTSSNAREWIELAMAYAPTILKLLASLGLFKAAASARRSRQRAVSGMVGPDAATSKTDSKAAV